VNPPRVDAAALHRDALVIDGLMFHGDGHSAGLRAAGVDAVNITVCGFEADFEAACDRVADWLGAVAAPCPSHKFRPAQKSYDFRRMTEIIT
jgi:hypothetical protein